jgi:SNF2 family DNA or RNA helicase
VQFRQLARIVGRICNSESWPFLYLTGDRNLDDRSRVIGRFRDDKSIKILIAGLKCGGLGYVSSLSPLFGPFIVPNPFGTLTE